MKKILFLLLCTVSIYGQTSNGSEQEFDYGIKNNSTQTITTPPYLTTTGIDGTQGKIPSALIAKTSDIADSLATKANDSEVVKLTGNQTISGIKRFSENTVFGNSQIPGILPKYHLTEFNATDNKSPIAISGGTSVIEYWKETEVPSYAWAAGLRNPSVHLEPKDSFKFSVSIDAAPFADVLDISDGGNLYTKGVLSENITTLTPTISGQPSIIKYVNSLNTTQPVKLVIYFHGAGTKQLNPFTDDSRIVIDALLSKGYIVAHSQAHGDNWGSQTAQNDYLALYNYISSAYNLSDVIFVGHSMGGLASLNMIAKNTIPEVTKWYGIFPVTNLYEAYYTEGFFSAIELAYGFSGSANYASATAGNDPNLYSESAYINKKYTMTASPGDIVISKATNSDLINAKLTGAGIYSYIVSATGNHGNLSHFIPKHIASFVYDRVDTNRAIVSNGINVGIGTGLALPIKKLTVEDVDNQFALKARSTGNPTYQSWYTSASTRRGYFGYPSQGDSDLRLVNEESGGDIELMANEGDVKAYTTNLITSGNSTEPITNTITNASVVTGGAGAKYQFKFGDVETGYLWNFFDGDYFSTVLKSSGYLAFNTGGVERFRIAQTGAATFASTVTATSFNGSATLTGTPTAPTAAVGTNTTQIATMEAVQTALVDGLATKEPSFAKNTAFNKNFGTTAGTVVEGGTLGSNAYTSTDYFKYETFTADANTLRENRSAFTYALNAPHNGTLVHFGAGGYGTQINTNYNSNGDSFSFRTLNGDAVAWNPWRKMWHDGNFDPANYLPLSGGAISGNVNVTGTFNGASGTFSSKVSTVGVTSVIESNGGFNAVSSNVNLDNTSFKITNSSASKVYAFTAGKPEVSNDGFGLWNVTDNTHPVWVEPSGDVSLNANTTVSGKVTATPATLDTQLATLGQVKGIADLKAPLDSPTLTGTPTAPTAPAGTNTTQIATTAFVQATRPYKVYTALLSQTGTSAPTATVLENTLGGTIVWTRSNIGQYVGTLTGAFTDQKTIIFVNRSNPSATAFDTNMAANVININTVGYTTFSNSAYVDGQTNSASIEIRVYN